MALPFVGEIRLLASNQMPDEWASCDGQLYSKGARPGLERVLGQSFGGDGGDNFAAPDLRGRVPMQLAPAHPLAQAGGAETVTLTVAELPAHTHELRASDSEGTRAAPAGNLWARSEARAFGDGAPDASMHADALAAAGGAQPHDNLTPFLGVRSILALNGRAPDDDSVEDVYLGEIRTFAYGQVPEGWVRCDGQLLSRMARPQLFGLIGNTYGGSGDMFAVPNLTGRIPLHRGAGLTLGQPGGEETHVLALDELPRHGHEARAAAVPGDDPSPVGRTWGVQSAGLAYTDAAPDIALSAAAVATAGGGDPHDNMPPFLALQFCMALQGEDPTVEFPNTEPFAGEIRLFPYDLAPVGWAFCDGGLVDKNVNSGLFTMLKFAYGGDGQKMFALPDLRGRAPLHPGQGPGLTARALGDAGGAASVTLTEAQLPGHSHEVRVRSASGSDATAAGKVFATAPARALSAGYSSQPPAVPLSPLAVATTGEGAAHNNLPPYLPICFCIALHGEVIF